MTGSFIPFGILAALLGLAAAGCMIVPRPPAPPSESIRASLGTVGVVSVVEVAEVAINQTGPVGAGQGALAGVGSVLKAGAGPGAVFAVPFLPFGALVGAIVGANNLITRDEAEDIKAIISQALAQQEPQADLRSRVIALAATDAKRDLVDLGVGGAIDPMAPPSYGTFAEKGAQAVLEVRILTASFFIREGEDNSDFVFEMSARARLVRVSDNRVLWSDEFILFSSPSHSFSEWKENDAALLKTMIDTGVESFAHRISDRTFLEVWSTPGE